MSEPNDALLDGGVTRGDVLAYGEPTDEEMTAINKLARGHMSKDDVYVVDAVPSDTSADSYFTRMDPATTLPNYAEDAERGVPILNSHGLATSAMVDLPIGRSFRGQLLTDDHTTERGGKIHATKTKPVVYSSYYLPRGMQTSTSSNDSIIRAIDTGVLNDVSVGFGNTKPRGTGLWYRCDECGNDGLRSPDCTHFPGQLLTKDGKASRVTWTVVNAGLREYSPVWRGANPSSQMVRKAEDLLLIGALSRADLLDIDQVTNRHLAQAIDWDRLKDKRRIVAMPTTPTTTGATNTDAPETNDTPATDTRSDEERRRDVLDEALRGPEDATGTPDAQERTDASDPPAVAASSSSDAPTTTEHTFVALLRAANVETEDGVRAVLEQAADGRRYRADLVSLCHKAGVRAAGASYNEERDARMLGALSTSELYDELTSRNEAARARFGKDDPTTDQDAGRQRLAQRVGGRQTEAGAGPVGDPVRGRTTTPSAQNDAAYSTKRTRKG